MGTATATMRLGFIGLGDLGAPMAGRLAMTGAHLVVHDRRETVMAALGEMGAHPAGSVAEVAAQADVIHLCVAHDHELASVVEAADGLLAHGRAGQVLVVHSTVTPTAMQQLARRAAHHDVQVLDAPVSGGGRDAAAAGTLTMMVGGDAAVLERCRPVLQAMANRIVHVGGCGAGQAVKLANNIMSHGNRLVYLEAVAFAASYGIAEPLLNEVVSHASGQSWVQQHFHLVDLHGTRHTMAGSDEHPYRFAKDLRQAVEAAHASGVAAPLTALLAHLAPSMYRERWQQAPATASPAHTPGTT